MRSEKMLDFWMGEVYDRVRGNIGYFAERRDHMEGSGMTEKEQAAIMIDIYTDLQRIQKAEDKEKELNNQLRKAKAKLEALGIVTENLLIE